MLLMLAQDLLKQLSSPTKIAVRLKLGLVATHFDTRIVGPDDTGLPVLCLLDAWSRQGVNAAGGWKHAWKEPLLRSARAWTCQV